ncbi:hypothetical protein FHS74_001967 [Nitrospirillum iridis]|uniref:Uncharacterized protein n=1 Tax=Nitrospirillum iridis TaxID=765888 RepID=A0A7X0EDW3_9PROT|nr:hypothetical protein [Nitrospirillum iridis]
MTPIVRPRAPAHPEWRSRARAQGPPYAPAGLPLRGRKGIKPLIRQ